MKVTVSSDDGKLNMEVDTSDIDLEGHSLNQVILMHRVESAIRYVAASELAKRRNKEPNEAKAVSSPRWRTGQPGIREL